MFAGISGGLLSIKLSQLLYCRAVDEIWISTDDDDVIKIAESFRRGHAKEVKILHRSAELATSETSTDDLILHVRDLLKDRSDRDVVLWTHVTSPFFKSSDYASAIETYVEATRASYDSLMTVKPLRIFLWSESGPVNYDPTVDKWPRTQTLPAVCSVNSAVFLAPVSVYRKYGNRIGNRPLLMPVNDLAAIDIDWQEDFDLAEQLWLALQDRPLRVAGVPQGSGRFAGNTVPVGKQNS